MEICPATSRTLQKEFLGLPQRVYAGLPHYRDNLDYAAKNFIYGKDAYAQACAVTPLIVRQGGEAVARAMLIHTDRLDALLLGFFEALPGCAEAVDLILERAEACARQKRLRRVLIGLNGHLTYGVGFLRDGFDLPPSFDGVYSAPWQQLPETGSGRGHPTDQGIGLQKISAA